MDAAWLNRGGILAEAVSFLFIAPEIIGMQRLERLERWLEEQLGTVLSQPLVRFTFGRGIPFLPAQPRSDLSHGVLIATKMVTTVPLLVIVNALVMVFGVRSDIVLFVAAGTFGAVLASLVGELIARRLPALRWLAYALSIPAVIPSWVAAIFEQATYLAVLAMTIGTRKLLSGPNRLRALVFGGGVVLLFGGMAAQFAATF
jgi:hypothetical protein